MSQTQNGKNAIEMEHEKSPSDPKNGESKPDESELSSAEVENEIDLNSTDANPSDSEYLSELHKDLHNIQRKITVTQSRVSRLKYLRILKVIEKLYR